MADEPAKVTEKPVEKAAAAPTESATKPAAGGAQKKNNTVKIVLIVVGVLVGLSILGTIAAIVLFGVVLNKATKNVDVKNGEVTIQSDDGQTKTSIGDDVSLASGFPTDVPIYQPSTLKASSTSGADQFSAVATTAKSVTDVTTFYKAQMAAQGWTTQYDQSSEGSSLLTFQKGNRTSSVITSVSEDANSSEKTGFVVSVTTQE